MTSPRSNAKQGIVFVLVLALLGAPAAGRAGTFTGGATEWTQISNNVQLTMQLVQQVMMVAQLIRQVKMMVVMTKRSRSPAEALAIMNGFHSILGAAANFVFVGKNLTDQWKRTHPGEQTPEIQGYGSIEHAYDSIDKDLRGAAEQSLKTLDVHLDPKNVRQDQQIAEQLKAKMETAAGQMQAQQATNELLLEIIRQLGLIRQVNIVQARMTAVGLSDEAQRRLYRSAVIQRDYEYRGLYIGSGAPTGWVRP
jgi:P-type conjugative transfer protein TrbJ